MLRHEDGTSGDVLLGLLADIKVKLVKVNRCSDLWSEQFLQNQKLKWINSSFWSVFLHQTRIRSWSFLCRTIRLLRFGPLRAADRRFGIQHSGKVNRGVFLHSFSFILFFLRDRVVVRTEIFKVSKASVTKADEYGDAENHQSEQRRGPPETCSEDREEVQPYEADDWCSQSLIDSTHVNPMVKASRQVSKV